MKPITKSLMKQLLTLTSVLAFAAAGMGVARASSPVLYNGDLNLVGPGPVANPSPLGWQVNGGLTYNHSFADTCDSETFCNGADDPDLSGSGLFLKPFQGSTNVINNFCYCYFYQDNPSYQGTTYTLSAWVCGQANYSGYDVGAPNFPGTGLFVQFLDTNGNVLATNSYDLIAAGLNNSGDPVPSVQYTTPSYTAPPGTATVRAGLYMTNVWSTTGAQSLLADDFDLEASTPAGAPVFTTEPTGATASPGGHASFTVVASPAPTSYVWRFNGAPVSGPEFSGANTATLTISPVSTNDVGHYTCLVANGAGGNLSSSAPLAINGIYLFPTISLTGSLGDTYAIERSSSVNGPWTAFSTNKLTLQPQYITDYTIPVSPSEFYQEVFLY
jgi:hypothetical protein